jgi:3',5'-cyclic AMP phosphodiesterase CpdA
MDPKPDFVMYGGDLAQLGTREEIDHGLELLAPLKHPTRFVIGEHDYYLDLGEYWQKKVSPLYYSFDHKGVHFVVLNSILTYDSWTHRKWASPMERMQTMAGLDNPDGSPFLVGDRQRQWLKQDLAKVAKDTPLVVFSHSPLQKIFKGWNFWTEDAEQVQALLAPFKKVTVFYGHVHQIQYNQIGNISFHAAMATAWPWPYPETYAQAPSLLPKLTVPMNRADPFFERDATGWQFIDLWSGNATVQYSLPENSRRTVAFDPKTGQPQDTKYQLAGNRIPPQDHY